MFSFMDESNLETDVISNYMTYFPIVMILFMFVFFGWFWSIAVGLQYKVPDNVKMKVTRFKILFFIPMVYMLVMFIFMGTTMNSLMESEIEPNVAMIGLGFAVIMPLHLFSMFCIFHSLFFVAKTFRTVELQREVKFAEFAGEFFLIWFYPIGIWIIQPRVNKLIEEERS